jgi:GxxExxY protein
MREPRKPLLHAEITASIIDSFRLVHRELGFGYRELIYGLALERDLRSKGHRVEREVGVMVYFRGEPLARQRIDLLVDRKVVVENKATLRLRPADGAQLFSLLCGTDLEVGLLLHFGHKPDFHRLFFENRFKQRVRPAG